MLTGWESLVQSGMNEVGQKKKYKLSAYIIGLLLPSAGTIIVSNLLYPFHCSFVGLYGLPPTGHNGSLYQGSLLHKKDK